VTPFSWIVAVTGWLLAAAAWLVARGAARRARQLHDMYWQLRYDHGELKARVDALAPEAARDTAHGEGAAPAQGAPRPSPGTQFVPLSQVKR
jgi:hypothetical protein